MILYSSCFNICMQLAAGVCLWSYHYFVQKECCCHQPLAISRHITPHFFRGLQVANLLSCVH